jgi:uncharacterized membrane protein YjfL (UPF0719 family)
MIILQEYIFTFGWALVGTLSMAVAFMVMMRVFNKLTPFNEWEEIKNGNIAVAITIAAIIFSAALVIASAIK